MRLRIKEAAALSGVSAKTLRYYDRIGLLSPSETTEAGYRIYREAELERLREILLLRELDFPLREIAALLDAPGRDRRAALRRQKDLLEQKRLRLTGIIDLADRLCRGDETMDFTPFHADGLDAAKEAYALEAQRRWGHTGAYRESRRRDALRTEADREKAQAEMEALLRAFAALRGSDPAAPEARELVRAWQAHITKWYYTCTPEILSGLGEMYTADPRFAGNMDVFGDGSAAFMTEAIRAYCGSLQSS